LEALEHTAGIDRARALYREWPLLRGLVDDARLALTQADLEVASFYARLASEEDRTVFALIREEHARTMLAVAHLTGERDLLGPWPAVSHAAERRNPAIDVLSHVQIELLGRLRRPDVGEEERMRVRDALLLTVNGIAAGLQTVG
jgi:phosphoenolpyruvate carboxylase